MKDLTNDQLEYAVGRFVSLYQSREIKQTELERTSGVTQSTISKIVSRSQESGIEKYTPSAEILQKLFQALGVRLADILHESDAIPDEISGYLATPLTGLSDNEDAGVRKVVRLIQTVSNEEQFASPPFEIYWPGDHTHPKLHADVPAPQVYVTDRSRASTHDFIIIFCGRPSFGVGQENEIATQAGVPAIRLVPEGLSRMMVGSFIRAIDIPYIGSLEEGVVLDFEKLRDALKEIRQLYFRNRAFYRGLNGDAFGKRLRKLLDNRCNGNDAQFADDVGISIVYLQKLISEPFAVSNPSAKLLKRMGHRLGERVGYLLGESEESDPVWVQSHIAWRSWIDKTDGLDASLTLRIRDGWRHEYAMLRRDQVSVASFRKSAPLMRETDWDKRYQELKKTRKGAANAQQVGLL
jgi:transcriptional regulator with XRE-family HTH domain